MVINLADLRTKERAFCEAMQMGALPYRLDFVWREESLLGAYSIGRSETNRRRISPPLAVFRRCPDPRG